MNRDKAIEILESPRFGTTWPTPLQEKDAIRLGSEALKRLQRARNQRALANTHLLPGETED